MKQIKIQLESPWRYTSGGMGKSLVENPPEGVKYFFKRDKKVVSSQNNLNKTRLIKKGIIFLSNIVPLIKEKNVSIIPGVNLIHCEHFLCKNNKIPWVVDTEGIWQFYLGKKTNEKKIRIHKDLEKNSCKKVIFWAKYAMEDAQNIFPDLKNKFTFIYPSIPPMKFRKIKKKGITLLFVGRMFYQKGGFHALEVMDNLTKKFDNVNAIYIGEIPEESKKFYSKNTKIKIMGLTSHEKILKDIYPQSDIFIYPGYWDSFGFAYLEAMSFGIPIVTVSRPNTKEIVEEGKTGFLVPYNQNKIKIDSLGQEERRLVNDFCDATINMITNEKLRKKMSRTCMKEINEGKFSMKKNHEKLRRVYEEALK